MGQKKRIKNKENIQPPKKSTLQHLNYTQQITIPTLNTIDIKNIAKSIQLKKQILGKKPASRKSRCLSVKQTCASVKQGSTQPVKYKQLLKRFQELKDLQEKGDRSKSKSAKSIRQCNKSRSPISYSKNKINSKKFNLTALTNKTLNKFNQHKTQFNSRMSLTNKLQRTLKKISQKEYFDKDQQDSLIPFISTSDAYNNEEQSDAKPYELTNQQLAQQDDININEMRKFCRTLQNQQFLENTFKKSIKFFKGNPQEMMATKIIMATKIQRVWRAHRLKKLVNRYADVMFNKYIQQERLQEHSQEDSQNYLLESDITSELQYHQMQVIMRQQSQDKKTLQNKQFLEHNKQFFEQRHTFSDNFLNNPKNSNLQESISKNCSDSASFEQAGQSSKKYSQQKTIQTEKLYFQSNAEEEHLVTYISNLQDDDSSDKVQQKDLQSGRKTLNQPIQKQAEQKRQSMRAKQSNNSQDNLINQMKKMEIQKWSEVIQLLEQSKQKNNPNDLHHLFLMLQKTSERNKKQLESIQKDKIIHERESIKSKDRQYNQSSSKSSNKKPAKIEPGFNDQVKTGGKRQESGPSETSDFKKQEEFDSRKYIQYLDSDMFLLDKEKSSENSELITDDRFGRRISKRKQKQLLSVLNIDDVPIRLRTHCVSKSQNLSYLIGEQVLYLPLVNHRLNKSISEKNIEKILQSISPQLQFTKDGNSNDNLNLDLIRQQFLQNADPIEQLQKFHNNEELKMKMKQSLEQGMSYFDQQSDDQEPEYPARISINLDKTFNVQPQDQAPIFNKISSRNDPANSKSNANKVIVIQSIDKNIQQDNQFQLSDDEQQKQKIENLCFMIYNTLILEVLKQIASYDSILQKFKDFSLAAKAQQKQGKKGFQTNHTEVKNYVEGLISYLLNQEPQVFKNLQIPAGPSALQMLHYMHPSDGDEDMDEDQNTSQDQTSVMVIPNRMFDRYWHVREKNLKFQSQNATHLNPQKRKKLADDLRNLTKVFYRSIFDTFNECLDLQRNFGQAGKPYPWKKSSSFHHNKTLVQIQKGILNSQKRMNQIATTYCGLIIQKTEMVRITMQGSDDYIQHVQEDRMSRMLAQDLIEGEERWTFYDDQELQLLVQIGNFITISLILEAAEEFSYTVRH